jgi:hypothetical protein
MADDDKESSAPSLEPPSFFRRKRAPKAQQSPAAQTRPLGPPPPQPPPPPPSGRPLHVDEQVEVEAVDPEPAGEPKPPRTPWLTGRAAAVVTGLLVGAFVVAATSGALRLCSEISGTESCGNPGFLLLVAILVVAVLIGGLMLRAARVPEPSSTSFLAVGLMSVVALLFLVDQLLEWWMIVVIPLVSVATYLLSHWVTTTYIDPAAIEQPPAAEDEQPEAHDIR